LALACLQNSPQDYYNLHCRCTSVAMTLYTIAAKFPETYRYSVLQYLYRRYAVDETSGYDWKSQHHNRIELINRIIAYLGSASCRYLEIGCQRNACFDSVMAEVKVGVDPAKGGTHRMTSDEYFSRYTDSFDVILIDGLHTFEQSRRDAVNGLARLRQGGFMLLHDVLPNRWEEEHVPRLSKIWTGDVWKTAVELTSTRGLTYRTVTIDHGIGVARKDAASVAYRDRFPELSRASYTDFLNMRTQLNLCTFDEVLSLLAEHGVGGA
jgi:hypothetical protein